MRKGFTPFALVLSGLMFAGAAEARDTTHMLSVQDVMATADAKAKLDPSIKFVFADAPHGKVLKRHGNFVTNKKTNAFGKSDQQACQWVMLSALISLQDRVKAEGGNAVVNIESYYKQQPMVSRTEYECHAGAIMAGVALRGDVVTLEK
ncbi:MAG TPA: excinuclease ATPase subunit [Pseudomonas xinjiangensis]|uniref:Excinuclease ATPase subunit n=2 Tax=root TaxID=1 RepID=A0A7V1FRZ9_9GAMM|nr:excinuclease ATPase subunit [Halopseudomonas xinjiangensis]HEC48608.1 excinuclease ATPase subunit [Halopseudomonas xinjiangensis]